MEIPKTSEEVAYEKLREAILGGELPHNQFLSQRVLAERMGTAVVTLRAVMRSLEKEGLLENVPHWGVRIPIETEEKLKDRYYLREILEVSAVERIIQQADPVQAVTLRELAKKCDYVALEAPDNTELFAQRHFAFHHYVAQCSGSALLVEALDRLHLKMLMVFNAKRGWEQGYGRMAHGQLAEDILSGDLPRAIQSIREHVRDGVRHEIEALAKLEPLPTDTKSVLQKQML